MLSIVVIVFLSGCIEQKEKVSTVGLSLILTTDVKKTPTSAPVTFILTMKNLASESARDISAQLVNLTDWKVENALQGLDELLPNDLYKFSWIAYAPSTPNQTFTPVANIFYRMETKANFKIRVYDNGYLNTLKSDEREKIKTKSALLSSAVSKKTPIAVTASLQQPFILASYSQKFPFVIEIKNVGLGQPYKDYANYPTRENDKGYVKFEYTGNSSLICDFDDGDLVKLINGSKSIVCRLAITEDDIYKYSDFSAEFSISYAYLDSSLLGIKVV